MTPTPWQVFCDPRLFTQLLEERGIKDAGIRVQALVGDMVEMWHLDTQIRKYSRERTQTHQESRDFRRHGRALIHEFNLDRVHRQARLTRLLISYRGEFQTHDDRIRRRISSWPDLDFDPREVRRRPCRSMVNRMLRKRRRRIA